MIQLWPFYGGNTDFDQLGMVIQIYIIKLLLNKRFNDFKNSFYDNRKFQLGLYVKNTENDAVP